MKMRSKSIGRRIICCVIAALMIVCALPSYGTEPYVSAAADDRVESILAQMTLEEKVAQMMVVAMPAKAAASKQRDYSLAATFSSRETSQGQTKRE